MKKVIPVDIYGHCSDNETFNIAQSHLSEIELLSNYKFYLAFENSRCTEYVTEKLYKIINFETLDNPPVPIVMGPKKGWYEKNLPPMSFIHVDDFSSPEELAYYLDHLNSNNNSYLKFLNWRQNHERVCEPKVNCKLCEYLLNNQSDETQPQKRRNETHFFISDFKSFWKKAECYGS